MRTRTTDQLVVQLARCIAAKLKAIHARHENIRDDEVVRAATAELEGALAVAGRVHLVVGHAQRLVPALHAARTGVQVGVEAWQQAGFHQAENGMQLALQCAAVVRFHGHGDGQVGKELAQVDDVRHPGGASGDRPIPRRDLRSRVPRDARHGRLRVARRAGVQRRHAEDGAPADLDGPAAGFAPRGSLDSVHDSALDKRLTSVFAENLAWQKKRDQDFRDVFRGLIKSEYFFAFPSWSKSNADYNIWKRRQPGNERFFDGDATRLVDELNSPSLWYDQLHLRQPGAELYSEEFAKYLVEQIQSKSL